MTCARSKHHPISCGLDELCLSGLWWDLFWYAYGEGRAIIYPVVVISDIAGRLDHSLVCTYIMPHLAFSVLKDFQELAVRQRPLGASQLMLALKRPHCPNHLQGAQAYVLWEPKEHLWQPSPQGRAIHTCAQPPLYCLSYTWELEKTEEMEGVHQLKLCQQRLIAVVTSAVCSSEIWPETMENAIENLGRRKQA